VVLGDIEIRGEDMDAVAVPEGSGLGIDYRWSVLSEDHTTGKGATQAGDRAPNAALGGSPDHAPHRLFDLLAGGRFTLLGFAPEAERHLRELTEARVTTTTADFAEVGAYLDRLTR
jgi:hypothetical protein